MLIQSRSLFFMKTCLPLVLVIFFLAFETHSLFNTTSLSNFTISGIINPTKVVMESSGSKFLVWNDNSDLRMYYANGSLLCSGTFNQQIQRIIWPSEFYPIVLPFPGLQFWTLNESTCQIIKNYKLSQILEIEKEQVVEMTFLWKDDCPYLLISGLVTILQINLRQAQLSNLYIDYDSPKYQTSVYSIDLKYLYVVRIDPDTGVRTVKIWQANIMVDKPIKQIPFATSVTGMVASSDNKTIICIGYSLSSDNTSILRFDNDGTVKTKASRTGFSKAIAIGQGNTVIFFKTGLGSTELVRAGDGQTIQNANFSNSNYFIDADYKNKILTILDSSGRVVTYSYEPDQDVQPIDPVNPEKSIPIWIFIVSGAGGALVLVIVLMFVLRKKLPKGLRKRLPKCFDGKTGQQKKPLLNEQENPRKSIDRSRDLVRQQIIKPNPIPNRISVQPRIDGIPPGMSDASFIKARKKEEQRLLQQQLVRLQVQQQQKGIENKSLQQANKHVPPYQLNQNYPIAQQKILLSDKEKYYFVQERQDLISKDHEAKPNKFIENQHDYNLIGKSFFVVKRKDGIKSEVQQEETKN